MNVHRATLRIGEKEYELPLEGKTSLRFLFDAAVMIFTGRTEEARSIMQTLVNCRRLVSFIRSRRRYPIFNPVRPPLREGA
jgi:hypothetical protein